MLQRGEFRAVWIYLNKVIIKNRKRGCSGKGSYCLKRGPHSLWLEEALFPTLHRLCLPEGRRNQGLPELGWVWGAKREEGVTAQLTSEPPLSADKDQTARQQRVNKPPKPIPGAVEPIRCEIVWGGNFRSLDTTVKIQRKSVDRINYAKIKIIRLPMQKWKANTTRAKVCSKQDRLIFLSQENAT